MAEMKLVVECVGDYGGSQCLVLAWCRTGDADHLAPDKTQPVLDMNQYRVGLSVRPATHVVAKLEAVRVIPRAKEMESEMWVLAAQTAVTF